MNRSARIIAPILLAAGMLLLVTLSALAVSTLGTRYSFEDATAQGWAGSATCTVGYHGTSNCKGSYCWYCTDVSGTHTYVTTTYEIQQAGIYYLDAYYKRRGYYRLYSASTDVDGYGVDETWAPPSWDPAWDVWWQAANSYMALVTGTWSIGTENWGTYTTRSFDYARLAWYGDSRKTSTGLVCDGHFRAPYTSNWTLYDPDGNSLYSSTYGNGAGAGTYDIDLGSMRLYTNDRLTTTITVPEDAGAISLSYVTGWTVLGAKYLLYNDAGALVDSHGNLGTTCAGSWCQRTDSWGALAAGSYDLVFTTSGDGFLDSVTVNCANPDVCVASDCSFTVSEPEEPAEWLPGISIYYPYAETDLWALYQPYGWSTYYGSGAENYVIWELRPGAPVYPIATLDIDEVGVNQNGYYIEAYINAWPDILSTTVRYEGLASVNVSAGQRVGVNCQLGTVGANAALGEYHLLLYVEYDGWSMDPTPYMTTYPNPSYCNVVDPNQPDTTGPGGGEVPSRLLQVCTECAVPTTWTNFGRWIAWLGCQVQNMFTCWMADWINAIVNMQILTLQQAIASADALQARFNHLIGSNTLLLRRVVDTSAWMVQPVNAGLSWTGGLATDGLAFGEAWITNVSERWEYTSGQIENVIMAVGNIGNDLIVLDLESGGGTGSTVWDVMLALISLLRDLLLAMLQLADTLLDFATDLFELLLMILSGLTGGIESADSIDLVGFALTGTTGLGGEEEEGEGEYEIFEFDPGGGGGGDPDFDHSLCGSGASAVWTVDGPSIAKGACWFVGGAVLADTIAFQSLIYYLLWAFVGALIIGLLMWVLGMSPDAIKGLFR